MARSAQQARKPKSEKNKQKQEEKKLKRQQAAAEKAAAKAAAKNDGQPPSKKPRPEPEEEEKPEGSGQQKQAPRAAKNKKKEGSDAPPGLQWCDDDGKPLSKQEIPPMVCLFSEEMEGRSKVAGFDIDWTVIQTASGRKFATGANDWKWWDEKVPDKMKELDKDGYRVIFVSNQAGVEKKKATIPEIQKRCTDIITALGIPVYVFFSTGENHFRKPSTEMWDFFVKKCNHGVKVNMEESMYIGDAAGRAKDWAPGKSRDFSCSDRMFAANVGVNFETPEEFFLGQKGVPFQWGSFDPSKASPEDTGESKSYHSKSPEIVVMVGMPASGKSSFAKKYLVPHGYVHINRDTLGTPAKCFKLASESAEAKKSVVVDNTNPSNAARADYIQLAKKNGMGCRCIYMNFPKDVAHHLNMVRQNLTEGEVRRIPDVGYHVFNKNLEEPKKEEGFTEVLKIGFTPRFEGKKHKDLFFQWTN